MQKSALFLSVVFFLFISVPQAANAQNNPFSIRVVDAQNMGIIGATVRVAALANPSTTQNGVTDATGKIELRAKIGESYQAQISFVGYKTLVQTVRPTATQMAFQFTLEEDTKALNEVTITAKKPLIEQVDDMTVVDPAPIVDISTNALDVMEKIPGLFVDQDGNIYLNSATPASIYINGREQKMSTSDVATLLRNLPPNSIEKIEVLRTPSAKFDASGSGGVVNVVLKKGFKIGLTGGVNGGMNQGRYGNQFVGFTLNNSDGERTSYLNMNVSNRNSYDQVQTNRQFTADSLLSQKSFTTFPAQNIFTGFGFGFEPRKKWQLNVDSRLNFSTQSSDATNQNTINRVRDGVLFSNSENLSNTENRAFSFNQEASAEYKLDDKDSKWETELTYSIASNQGEQMFSNRFILPAAFQIGGDGTTSNQRQNFVAKTDLKYQLPYKLVLETGLKTSLQQVTNEAEFYKTAANNTRTLDTFRTRTFNYDENISAAYFQASKTVGTFTLKTGARLENTNIRGQQKIPTTSSFQVKRTDLFPYAYLSRSLMTIAGYDLRGYLVYRRSITRPSYDLLNPSPRYIDQYLYEVGNPKLLPQFTRNMEMNVSVKDMPIFALGRNYTQDIFNNVVYQDPTAPSVAIRTYDNLGKNTEDYFKLTGALPPGGRYFFVLGIQYGRNRYNGTYENKPLTFDRGSWTFFTFHSFKIDKASTLTMNGFLKLKGQVQFYELDNFGALNFSLNRKFLKDKLTVSLSANDVLFTSKNSFVLNQGSVNASGIRQSDSRRFGFNIRYNFGIRKKEEQPNMMNMDNLEKINR
jgi:outer membrane receptor protein involved in Fe transport